MMLLWIGIWDGQQGMFQHLRTLSHSPSSFARSLKIDGDLGGSIFGKEGTQ